MELEKVVEILEQIAPLELADDFDVGKIGLILGLENDIKKIAVVFIKYCILIFFNFCI